MYERFNDAARGVMALANREAQRLNHEYIGTEHILLAIIKHRTNEACQLLASAAIDLDQLAAKLETTLQRGPDAMSQEKCPQTPRAKKVIEYAMEEARNFNVNYVGVEHLLLGLLRESEGMAALKLGEVGIKLDEMRLLVGQMMADPVAGLQVRALLEKLRERTGSSTNFDALNIAIDAVEAMIAISTAAARLPHFERQQFAVQVTVPAQPKS